MVESFRLRLLLSSLSRSLVFLNNLEKGNFRSENDRITEITLFII